MRQTGVGGDKYWVAVSFVRIGCDAVARLMGVLSGIWKDLILGNVWAMRVYLQLRGTALYGVLHDRNQYILYYNYDLYFAL